MGAPETGTPERVTTPLDRGSPLPLFLQIRQFLLGDIYAWPDKALQFPTDDALARRFGVSRMTVRQAIDDLVKSGLLTRHRGRGTFLTDHAFIERLSPALDIDQQYSAAGRPQSVTLLGLTKRAASDRERALLSLEAQETVVEIRRLRSASGRPLALDERVLASALAGRAGFDRATAEGSIVGRLRAAVRLERAHWSMRALAAGPELAALLIVEPQAPLLERAMRYYDSSGAVVMIGRTVHRSDVVRCEIELPLSDDAG
jgi:GntR family transcriptional regulator